MPGVTIFGITGRMGQTMLRALREVPVAVAAPPPGALTLRLCGAVASSRSDRLAQDAALDGPPSGIMVTADPAAGLKGAGVAVDFSLPACVTGNARACAAAGVPLLVGVTGFDAGARAGLVAVAEVIPVLIAPNTSVGVSVLEQLVKLATRALGRDYDVEISEAHHRFKRDAPSGTALSLGAAIAGVRGQSLEDVGVFDRHGTHSARTPGEIGFSVVRAGDIVGEHTVTFAGAGERVEVTHRAADRITFARGALRAAAWLIGRPAGLYSMADSLGLSTGVDSDPPHR